MEDKADVITVLDSGYIRLVDHMGSDLSVVRAARVSYNAAWRSGLDSAGDAKLIKYLWKNKHTTPFEAPTLTFDVKAPIFVFRQWHRHRTQSYNELSARYAELSEEFYVPEIDKIGFQSKSNKQVRTLDNPDNTVSSGARSAEIGFYRKRCHEQFALYNELLKSGWPRELARMCLPVSTYSSMFTTGNLLNFFKFITLRKDSHAQYEIRVYAEAMLSLINRYYPVCVEAYLTRETPA